MKHFRWRNVFDDICRTDVNRSTFDEDARKTIFTFSVPVTFDIQTSNLLLQIVLPMSSDMSALNQKVSTAFLFQENWRHVTDGRRNGQTDRQADEVQHLQHFMRTPSLRRRFSASSRSANRYQLIVPRCRLNTYGRRAFSIAGPTVWNSLPDEIRDPACVSGSFKQSGLTSALEVFTSATLCQRG